MRVRPMTISAALCILAVVLPVMAADIPIATGSPTSISPDRIWTEIAGPDVRTAYNQLRKRFPRFTPAARVNRVFVLDTARLESALNGAPQRPLLGSRPPGGKEITLPLPDGEFVHFEVFETPVLPPPLAAQFPELRTYSAIGIDRPATTASIEKTVIGWSAMIFGEDGMIAISAVSPRTPAVFVSIAPKMMERRLRFRCKGSAGTPVIPPPATVPALQQSFGGTTRLYRLAIAARSEYVRAFLFSSADTIAIARLRALNEISKLISRMNQVFGKDLGIQFIAIKEQPDIVFDNPKTDPFVGTTPCKNLVLQNQFVLTGPPANGNFDIGHLVGTTDEGCAAQPCACNANRKGMGSTGITEPFGDPFYIGYVAHEIGHQFGASHSFNAFQTKQGQPCNNREATVAYEPGSGSTIMGYAPNDCTGGQKIVDVSEDYFHAVSVAEIVAELNRAGGSGLCATQSSNGDRPPTVAMTQAVVQVPKRTPFQVSVIGSDPDGRDHLVYTWEQLDLAEDTAPPNDDSDGKLRPMFRSVRIDDQTRFFPSVENLASGKFGAIAFETSPQSGKPLHFRVLARDQRGGFAFADATVNVVTTAGPFTIKSPQPPKSWTVGTQETVTWEKAHTPDAPLSCLNVRISFSADGGKTFVTLVASTPNDGAEPVTVPSTPTKSAVVRIDGIGQAFFAVSRIFRVKK